ncbi:MAG: GntR family transcriptional regulator [Alphaproteobacteria bacterium]|nr:GntR family transcriptional regulator [Alphaproteobacteria bacterium]
MTEPLKLLRRHPKVKPQKLQRLSKTTLQDQAYSEIKEALMSGHFTPGDILVIRALAAEMGTSIMPVRDALQRLVAERALTLLPSRTVQVPLINRREFDQMTAIRIRLESLATETAAARVTPAMIASLRHQNRAMIEAIAKQDAEKVLEANKTFHFTLYQASESEMLVGFIESLWLRIGPLLKTPWRMANGNRVFDSARDTHQLLIEALEDRDTDRAAAAIVKDITDAAEWYRGQNHAFSGEVDA